MSDPLPCPCCHGQASKCRNCDATGKTFTLRWRARTRRKSPCPMCGGSGRCCPTCKGHLTVSPEDHAAYTLKHMGEEKPRDFSEVEAAPIPGVVPTRSKQRYGG